MGKPFTRRGVSTIIAALLLIAIAVAAAVLLYVFSIGLLGSLQGGGGQQVKQQLIMAAYNWNDVTKAPSITMRNVGTAGITVSDVFINGVAGTPTYTGCTGGAIPVQSSCSISIAAGTGSYGAATNPTAGVAYTIKVVSADGGVFSYSAIAGQSN